MRANICKCLLVMCYNIGSSWNCSDAVAPKINVLLATNMERALVSCDALHYLQWNQCLLPYCIVYFHLHIHLLIYKSIAPARTSIFISLVSREKQTDRQSVSRDHMHMTEPQGNDEKQMKILFIIIMFPCRSYI